jgi:transcriptional regulator with PAS, ATPase and Fis domain
MTKKIITGIVETLSQYDLEGSLRDIKQFIDKLISQHGEDAFIDMYASEGVDVSLHKQREETDQEYADRLAHEKAREEFERKQYEALKKKYG